MIDRNQDQAPDSPQQKQRPQDLQITGLGVVSAIGQGQSAFAAALLGGQSAFGIMQRSGRQKDSAFLGAEIAELIHPQRLSKKLLRTASYSARAALTAVEEAWTDAKLDHADPERIGLIVGGSNMQQRELLQTYDAYRDKAHFISPSYGFKFMDSDIAALCTEQFGIRGIACTVGGASASGQLAVIQACQAVLSDQVDICIAVGALADISYLECQAFRALGAMGSERYADRPQLACRPFDKSRDGFLYGENCGAVVVERQATARRREAKVYAGVAGWSWAMDGNRNPNPSLDGEIRAIRGALEHAGFSGADIDYVNPHGTGSLAGDETELQALAACGLSGAWINTTKSIAGHGLSAAGAVEIIATLVQMQASLLHPSLNLEEPLDDSFRWVRGEAKTAPVRRALNVSIGFGGINTALILEKDESHP